jgi:hypothetical protein
MSYEPKLRDFTFADSGIKVQIRKVSPNLMRELEKAFPPPKPPVERVNYGTADEPEWREEENPLNDAYRSTMDEYNTKMEDRIQALLIKRGVVMDMTEDVKASVDELRQQWREDFNADLPEDDKLVFIKYIAAGTIEDLTDLIMAIMRRSQPLEEDIQAEEAAFQGKISG